MKRPLPPRTMGNPLSVFSKKDEPQEEVAEVAVANPSFRRTREVQVANPSFRRGKPEAKPKVSHDNVASIGESVAMMLHSEFGHDHAEMLGDHNASFNSHNLTEPSCVLSISVNTRSILETQLADMH